MDSAQLADVPESIIAAKALIDVYDADDQQDFANRVLPRFPEGTEVRWHNPGLLTPNTATIFEPNGTLWVLAAGLENYGTFFFSVASSDPVLVPSGPYLVHPLCYTTYVSVANLCASYFDAGQVQRIRLVGHSMGGAAMVLQAAVLLDNGQLPTEAVIYSFGAAKPGNRELVDRVAGVKIVRWQNDFDPIPLVPPSTGFMTLVTFSFPISTFVGLAVGYKQVGGGRLIAGQPTAWTNQDYDLGLLNLLTLADWLFHGNFQWTGQHSLVTYLTNLQDIQFGNDPALNPALLRFPTKVQPDEPDLIHVLPASPDATTRNRSTTMADGPMMAVSLKGQLGGQGWSFNFYTNTLDYGIAQQKGLAVKKALLGAMSKDATIFAVVCSKTNVQGDSQDVYAQSSGGLAGTSYSSAPPNLAARLECSTAGKNRRTFWVHGLTTEIFKGVGQNTWYPDGDEATALTALGNALLKPGTGTGLINSGTGMYNRIINAGDPPWLGEIKTIGASLSGKALLEMYVPHLIPPNVAYKVQVRGRVFLSTVRGVHNVVSVPTATSLELSTPYPLDLAYEKGGFISTVGFKYLQPDALQFTGIVTHRTGIPFGLQRGRRTRRR